MLPLLLKHSSMVVLFLFLITCGNLRSTREPVEKALNAGDLTEAKRLLREDLPRLKNRCAVVSAHRLMIWALYLEDVTRANEYYQSLSKDIRDEVVGNDFGRELLANIYHEIGDYKSRNKLWQLVENWRMRRTFKLIMGGSDAISIYTLDHEHLLEAKRSVLTLISRSSGHGIHFDGKDTQTITLLFFAEDLGFVDTVERTYQQNGLQGPWDKDGTDLGAKQASEYASMKYGCLQ